MADASTGTFFTLRLDTLEIGRWTSCQGLGIQVAITQRQEGGTNGFVHQLPGQVSYTNIKLTRTVDADSPRLAAWLSRNAFEMRSRAHTAEIVATYADGSQICSWKLNRVVPVSWTGPSFSIDDTKPATETLELAHHGFLDTLQALPASVSGA